jgi:hypothetical protein
MIAHRCVASALLIFGTSWEALGASPQAQAFLVPNSSFEDPDKQGALPHGWEFQGPRDATASAWTAETPFGGNRALRIDARRGSQHWQSKPIELPSDREYLLTWQTRFQGEKSWRFQATFCGVEVIFQDEHHQPLERESAHTHCWQTPGWQPAWLRLTAPENAKYIVIRFGIDTDASLPGGFDVDLVELVRWPATSTDANRPCLNLQIRDEKGAPTAARLRVVSSEGSAIRAAGSVHYQIGGAFHPLNEGACQLLVPPDGYQVTATKGFEYWPWSKMVSVGRADTRLDIELERAWDWTRRGWFCGDHHVHLYRHGGSLFPFLTWRDVMRVARCEGLQFLPFMGADHYPTDDAALAADLQRPDFVAELSDEMTEDFWGHVCPIGVTREKQKTARFDKGPMNLDRDAEIAGSGILCYAHPYGPFGDDDELAAISDPKRGLVAREFPLDLALGMRCGFDLLTMEGNRNQLGRKLKDIYRLYNLGFRPALTASTDFHVDQGRQPIGAVRTYVRCDELRMPAVAAAYRAGRTFATNGPLIDLKVGTAAVGEEIALTNSQQSVPVNVDAVSIGRIERVEIIVNGRTAHTLSSADPHRISGTYSLPVRNSLWVAAKAVGPEDPNWASELEGRRIGAGQFAHTSPVYVLVENRPILAAQKEDAQYFARWCDATLKAWRSHSLDNPSSAEEDRLVRQRVDHAKSVFLEFAARLPE